MHGYSTDPGERRIVPLLLASVAIALAWLSSKILVTQKNLDSISTIDISISDIGPPCLLPIAFPIICNTCSP